MAFTLGSIWFCGICWEIQSPGWDRDRNKTKNLSPVNLCFFFLSSFASNNIARCTIAPLRSFVLSSVLVCLYTFVLSPSHTHMKANLFSFALGYRKWGAGGSCFWEETKTFVEDLGPTLLEWLHDWQSQLNAKSNTANSKNKNVSLGYLELRVFGWTYCK